MDGVSQATTFGRQGHAARLALEQRHPERGLELAHMVADRGRRQVQLRPGPREAVVARGGGEGAKCG
jgi:hypothetical protein